MFQPIAQCIMGRVVPPMMSPRLKQGGGANASEELVHIQSNKGPIRVGGVKSVKESLSDLR